MRQDGGDATWSVGEKGWVDSDRAREEDSTHWMWGKHEHR